MPFMMNISLMRAKKGREGQYAALYSIAYGLANIIAPAVGLGIAGYFGFQTLFIVLFILGLMCTLGFARLFANTEVTN
jgi:MFS family permease